MTKREKLIEMARQARRMPGGPTGFLHERERALEELGIKHFVASGSVKRWLRRSGRLIYHDSPEAAALRAAWFGWELVDGRWNW
jgi:hypothetical protein